MADQRFADSNPPPVRWRWLGGVALLLVLPIIAIFPLRETDGATFAPANDSAVRPVPEWGYDVSGTAGVRGAVALDVHPPGSPAVIRDVETITGLVDGRPLAGRKVDLHVPIAGRTNGEAFWVGQKDNRVLVVVGDNRGRIERVQGVTGDRGVAALEIGKTAAISGSIQTLPDAKTMSRWGLTPADRNEVEALGVYLRADAVSVQETAGDRSGESAR